VQQALAKKLATPTRSQNSLTLIVINFLRLCVALLFMPSVNHTPLTNTRIDTFNLYYKVMQEMTKAHIGQHSLDMIADMRDWELSRLQIVTDVLREKVREAYSNGLGVTELAKKAGVTRRTIQQWIE
jgi:hypothetical protein